MLKWYSTTAFERVDHQQYSELVSLVDPYWQWSPLGPYLYGHQAISVLMCKLKEEADQAEVNFMTL